MQKRTFLTITVFCIELFYPVLWAEKRQKKVFDYQKGAITYSFSGGRFGDNTIAYYHAKWASFVSGLPLLYKQFKRSDELMMHELEIAIESVDISKFRRIVTLKKGDSLEKIKRNSGILYIIPYFPECLQEHECGEPAYLYFKVDWENPLFKQQIITAMTPREPIQLLKLPENVLTVGIHIRYNSNGFDPPLLDEVKTSPHPIPGVYSDVGAPLKHVPLRYYVRQLQRILQLYPVGPVYVYILTDDLDPARFVKLFKESISDLRVIYDYRKDYNAHTVNIVEDFHNMTLFDCFIRTESNIGIAASKIAHYKTLIYPVHHYWEGNNLIIDKVQVNEQVFDN